MDSFNKLHVFFLVFSFLQDKWKEAFFQIWITKILTLAEFLQVQVVFPLNLRNLNDFHQGIIVDRLQFFVWLFPNYPVYCPELFSDSPVEFILYKVLRSRVKKFLLFFHDISNLRPARPIALVELEQLFFFVFRPWTFIFFLFLGYFSAVNILAESLLSESIFQFWKNISVLFVREGGQFNAVITALRIFSEGTYWGKWSLHILI